MFREFEQKEAFVCWYSSDFNFVFDFCLKSQDRRKPVCDVDRSVLGLCKLLEDVTPQGIDCLRGFLEPRCLDFVGWLRENMKGILGLAIYCNPYFPLFA